MKLTRRTLVSLGAASTAGLIIPGRATASDLKDGVGPNRGIVARGRRSKHTCDNESVPLSDSATRISLPSDFSGQGCNMIEDSFEGPYFTCAPAPGKDITYGESGQPLIVAMRLIDGNCQPIPGGVVDVWACNAEGYYSGYDQDPDKSPPMIRAMLFGHLKPDIESRFCRGALRTDENGIAEFDTVYPGFYYSQPIHIHFKAHVNGRALLTSQANLSEAWNDRIMQTAPYNALRPIKRTVKETGFPQMRIVERAGRLVAVLDLVVPT